MIYHSTVLRALSSLATSCIIGAIIGWAPCAVAQKGELEPALGTSSSTVLCEPAVSSVDSTGRLSEGDRGSAQEVSPNVVGVSQETPQDQGSVFGSIGLGIGLGAAGFVGGWLIGFATNEDCSGEYCQLGGGLLGAAVGGAIGLPVGIHLGNHRRGSLALDLLTSAVALGAGVGIAVASDGSTGVLVAIPIVQLVGTFAVERAVGGARSRRGRIAVGVVPGISGGAALAASVTF